MGDGRSSGQDRRPLNHPATPVTAVGDQSTSATRSPVESIIRRRRMTRTFQRDPVDRQFIVSLLDTARRAPSAGFSQGTHFLVLFDHQTDQFWDITESRVWFADRQPGLLAAPVVVLALADPLAYTSRYSEADKVGHGLDAQDGWATPYWIVDAAMATQNLLLLAEEHGLGALFFGIFRNDRQLLDLLGVPTHVVAIGAVALGTRSTTDSPSGSPRIRRRRALDEVVHQGTW